MTLFPANLANFFLPPLAAVVVYAAGAGAQLPQCVKDPYTGRWISPVEGKPCTTRPPVVTPGPAVPAVDMSHAVIFNSPEIRGEVVIYTPSGGALTGNAIGGTPIPFGSRIVTGPSGHFRATLPDGALFTLGAGGELVIDDFVYDSDPGLRKITLSLVKGFFRWVTGKVGLGVQSEVEKPHVRVRVGTIGFRGTDAEIFQDPDGSGYIKMYEGEVVLTPYDTDRDIVVRGGQILKFDQNGVIAEPTAVEGEVSSGGIVLNWRNVISHPQWRWEFEWAAYRAG